MPFVRRDVQGALTSLHRHAEALASEWLADDDAEVKAFLGARAAPGFDRLDADFIRVLEDLIDVLVQRHVINMTDLPVAAQAKLANRRGHRRPTALNALNLLGDAPDDASEDARDAESGAMRGFNPLP